MILIANTSIFVKFVLIIVVKIFCNDSRKCDVDIYNYLIYIWDTWIILENFTFYFLFLFFYFLSFKQQTQEVVDTKTHK